jgi:formylglycine-generating enzyme required for sulfatase activity
MRAVGGITWRTAAIYCNWLHNGKGTSRDALLSGAYDVSTFSGGFGFTDQLTRSAGARFFIPSLDEWMKAAHYDPTKANPDGTTGGWWNFANGRDDRAPIYGPAGFTRDGQPTEANAAWNNWTPQVNPFSIPLGAYNVTSPWGLYDTSGAGAEWTEEYLWFQPIDPLPRSRYADGGYWTGGSTLPDTAGAVAAGDHPGFQDWIYGFRVASIPSPGSGGLVVVFACALAQRRRRFPRP